MDIKIFNLLPNYIKGLINEKQVFKKELERFRLDNIFYSIGEYFNFSNNIFDSYIKQHILNSILRISL